jgi:hypothetical protein
MLSKSYALGCIIRWGFASLNVLALARPAAPEVPQDRALVNRTPLLAGFGQCGFDPSREVGGAACGCALFVLFRNLPVPCGQGQALAGGRRRTVFFGPHHPGGVRP